MDGDIPDLRGLLGTCRALNACLLVDVCHDLGTSGPNGTGTLGRDGILGEVDIVVGSLSKAFCANGGFMLVNDMAAVYTLKCFSGPYAYSTSFSPIQVSIALEAIRIAKSDEGECLRQRLRAVSTALRSGLCGRGFKVYGEEGSPIVPLHLGREGLARIAGGRAFELGLVATVIEFPVVTLGAARYRFSLKPNYKDEQIDAAIELTAKAVHDAHRLYDELNNRMLELGGLADEAV